MPIILKEDEGKVLGKRQIKVPDEIVDKLKLNRNLFAAYTQAKGYKRINSIIDDGYNKRSNKKDKIHNDDKTVSFSDLKRIDFDLRHTPTNKNNLDYVLQEPLKQWANDELKKLRTSVRKVKCVPPVPKIDKKPLSLPKAQKDIKMGNASVRITESTDSDWLPYYDSIEEINAYSVLYDFIFRETDKQQWLPLIQPDMYKKALLEFVRYGKFIYFPTKYVYQWMGILLNNTAKLRANTEWVGHLDRDPIPIDVLEDAIENYPEYFEKYIKEFGMPNEDNCFEFMDEMGFYDWMNMPDGSDAWSDYGLPALEKIICEYREDMTPEQTIVIINKALDCTHPRGDLSSIFIVGGSKTLTNISESIEKGKKIIFTESQLLTLKKISI